MKIMNEINSNYTYDGRLNRLPYILTTLAYGGFTAINVHLFVPAIHLWGNIENLFAAVIIIILAFFYSVLFVMMIIYYIFQTMRRLHDLNVTGWAVFIRFSLLIPYFNAILIWVVLIFELALFVLEGTDGPNEYGEDPKMN